MVGRTSISGVQRKISLRLSADRTTLQLATEKGRYLLKPQAQTYPTLPENEHTTMRLAGLFGIDIPPCGLVRLKDGTWAYIIARFDRTPENRKLRQEDFCQLAGKPPKEKYDGSAELLVRLLRKYATEPLVEILRLYRLLVFSWWTGNGDMHLKNFSLLADPSGVQRLSPAYDLLSTRLVIENDPLALPVLGRKTGLDQDTWLKFATYCELPARAAERVLRTVEARLDPALEAVARSELPTDQKERYSTLLRARAAVAGGRRHRAAG